MKRLYLSIPNNNDVWVKKEMNEDPATMDYNAGYNVSYGGYNYSDGTIKTDLKDIQENWLPQWINKEPNRYFAFIRRIEDEEYIGYVYFKDKTENGQEIGVLIRGKYRGKGYATEAVKLLCEKADNLGVEQLFHQIPDTRKAAIKADLNNGFVIVNENIPCKFTKFGQKENEILLIRTSDLKSLK